MYNMTQSDETFVRSEIINTSPVPSEAYRNVRTGLVDIFSYSDYRKFLMHRFLELQSRNPAFSQRRLAKNSGITNPGFFNEVIKGRRKLTHASTLKFSVGLRLTEEETEFFVTMVKHADAKDSTLKQIAGNRLRKLRLNRLNQGAGTVETLVASERILKELADHWTPISAHLEILSESCDEIAPVLFNGGGSALCSSLELLTDVREVATERWEQSSNIRDRVFQIVMLVKPVIRDATDKP